MSERKLPGLLDDARNRANVIVLDACRDNPTMRFRREGKKGPGGGRRGSAGEHYHVFGRARGTRSRRREAQ